MGIDVSDIPRLGRDAQAQIAAKLAVQEVKRSKYGNVKDERGGIKFDSKKEARRYDELMLMLKAGKIRNLKLQPQFTLQESYITPEGERVRAIRYVADFSYEEYDAEEHEASKKYGLSSDGWFRVVEDVKSRPTRTPQYKLKRKLVMEKYELDLREV